MKIIKLILTLAAAAVLALPAAASSAEGSAGVLDGVSFSELPEKGFVVPLPEGEEWQGGADRGTMGLFGEIRREQEDGSLCTVRYYNRSLDNFITENNPASSYYDQMDFSNELGVASETGEIDGHPARMVTFGYNGSDGKFAAYGGIIMYARDMQMIQVRVYSEKPGAGKNDIRPVTMDDLELLASNIRYEAEKAPIRYSDVEFTIEAEDGVLAVAAGKSIKLEAVFGNREIVNAASGNNEVEWEVYDFSTGEISTRASINQGGILTAEKGVQGPVRLEVRARSVTYDTTARCTVTIVDAAEAVSIDPREISFYEGTDESEVVTAIIEPDTILPIGIQWKLSKEGIISLEDLEDGTAVIRPLKAGKVTLSVSEPGGKASSVHVTVMTPVKGIELSAKGKTKPGSTVSLTAKLDPRHPSNKNVEWSVDVESDVATINQRGKLKISKEAPVGSVITVTCKAMGAPEPVLATMEIEVTEQ